VIEKISYANNSGLMHPNGGIMAITEETDDPGCCSIDYGHHKAVFERRQRAYREDPSKAVTVHEARVRLVNDHLKEART